MSVFKKCTKCGIDKPIDMFHKQEKGKYGRRGSCKACFSEYSKERMKNPVIKKRYDAFNAEFRKNNPNYGKKWRNENAEHSKEYQKRWLVMNRHIHNAKCAKRRAAQLNATPKWANQESIKSLYSLASFLNMATFSNGYHIDHIIPLQGKNVCGLHVENNLSILRAFDNRSKGNSFVDFS